MDLLETFDRYLNLPRDQAYNEYLDEKNVKIFKHVLTVVLIVYAIVLAVNIADQRSFNLSLFITLSGLIIIAIFRTVYGKVVSKSNVRRYLFIFLISQLLIFISIDIFYPEDNNKVLPESKAKKEVIKKDTTGKNGLEISVDTNSDESYANYFFMFAVLVMVFRFSRTEIIQLFPVGIGVPLLLMLFLNSKFEAGVFIPNMLMGLLFFFIAYSSERKRQRKFYEQYDFYYKRNFENLRMKKELNYAREIQLSMLPENEATIGEIEIAAVSLPASEVGGDYFDYFKVSDKEVGIFICDVSGHGVASGLLLSGLRSCMHLILEDNTKPSVVIEKLNRMIRKTQNRKMFVTAVFAIIDLEKNKCTVYNAGHLPPFKISGESKEIFKIKKHGIALGAMNTVDKAGADNEVVFDFRKNDKIIFYTDGVNEAMNEDKEEYGLENLEFFLNTNAEKKANELLKGLLEDVKKFTKNNNQRDDLTLLIIQRN